MRYSLILLFIFLAIDSFYAQVHGNIENYLNEYVENIPGSSGNVYRVPSESELDTWSEIMSEFFSGNYYNAYTLAAAINYELVEFVDEGINGHNRFYIFQEKFPRNKYWGTYVFSEDPVYSDLVLQAPHPTYDTNTGFQAIYCFRRLIPRALFISGTHRCNSNAFSTCSGTTTACGGSTAYRVSDNAHNTNSVFQLMTETLFDQSESNCFVQLHGFAKLSSDPYLIMSNGTNKTPEVDYLSRIQIELQKLDPVLTFKIAHIHTDWTRLIATTNTQGRYINSSPDPCHQNASTTSGRFIHIEQEKSRLRADSTGWYKMFQALKYTFTPDSLNRSYTVRETPRIFCYPNPSRGKLWIQTEVDTQAKIDIMDMTGRLVFTNFISTDQFIDIDFLPPGTYLIQFNTPSYCLTDKMILLE